MNKLSQEQVWNIIGKDWKTFRVKTPLEVKEFLKGKHGRILDLGCGSGRNLVKQKGLEWHAVDFSGKMLEYARKSARKKGIKAKFFKASVINLPFEDNFFDCAIFISTLHCVEGEKAREKTLKELYRVMKKNAEVMISVWDRSRSRQKEFGEIGKEFYMDWKSQGKAFKRYIYLYDEKELEKEVKKAGFKVLAEEVKLKIKDKHSKKNIILYCKK